MARHPWIARLDDATVKWRQAIAEEERRFAEIRVPGANANWHEDQAYGERASRHYDTMRSLKLALADAVLSVYKEGAP